MKIAEVEGLRIGFKGGRHGFSVDEKRRSFKRINFGFLRGMDIQNLSGIIEGFGNKMRVWQAILSDLR